VGGLAVSARTEPRLTRDADLAVLVADDRDAEALVRDLQARGWRVVAAIEQNVASRLATVRLALAGEDVRGAVVDLLFARPGSNPRSWPPPSRSMRCQASLFPSHGSAISLP
jgi:hypothetical protein